MKIIYTLIFSLFFILHSLHAQINVSGTVVDEANEIIEGAIINLYESDTISLIEYSVSDDNGKFNIRTSYKGDMILEVGSFGYESQFKSLNNKDGNQNLSFKLLAKSFDISEVTISADEIGVSQKGDTLTFHIQQFTTGAERNLGDVLNRLPGIEIRDGSVYYNNEKITKMLVQGKDIINSNQKLAIEGIRADQIKNIKVLQNYKDSDNKLETGRSEDVAMDVRLNDNELDKWSGNVEVLGGYPESFKGDFTTFNLGNKIGISAFARINNIGESALSWRDMQSMMDLGGGRRGFQYTIYVDDNIIPSTLLHTGQVQRNLDGTSVVNIDYKINEKLNLKGFLMGAYAERESENSIERNYIQNDDVLKQKTTDISKVPVFATFWKFTYDLDSSSILKFSLPFSFSLEKTTINNVGYLNEYQFDSDNTSEFDNYKFTPSATFDRKLGSKSTIYNQLKFSYQKEDGFNYFSDIFSFLNLPLNPVSNLYELTQLKVMNNTGFDASTRLKTKWDNNFYIEPALEYHYNDVSYEYESEQNAEIDLNSDDNLIENTGAVNLSFGYEGNDWEFKPNVGYTLLSRETKETELQKAYPSVGLTIQRIFNQAKTFTINTSYGLSYANFGQVRDIYEVNDTRSITTGRFNDFETPTKSFSINTNFNNYNPLKSLWMYFGGGYSKTYDVISSYTNRLENYLINAYAIAPGSDNINSWGGFGFNIKNYFRTRFHINHNYNDGYTVVDANTFQGVKRFSQSYGINLHSDWEFPLNVEVGITYGNSGTTYSSNRFIRSESISPELELEFKLQKLFVEVAYNYDVTFASGASTRVNLLDARLTYQLEKIPLSFIIEGSNLLNFTPAEIVQNDFTDVYNQTRYYTIFPGYIVGGINYEF